MASGPTRPNTCRRCSRTTTSMSCWPFGARSIRKDCAIRARCFRRLGSAARCRDRTTRIHSKRRASPSGFEMQLVGERRGGPSGPPGIDGVMPREIVEPASAEDVAAVLAAASNERNSVVIRGGGTKMGWGRKPPSVDLVLSTKALNAVVAHEHADLTATVQAGARLDEVNHILARHGQWLPIESAFDESTIGGAIATNDSGPLRHRYGTPRDLLIGIRLALTDGRLIKAGGNVVKNVAGYDIGRLMSGSHGSLAALVSATFKLSPLPAATQTLVATFDRADTLVAAVSAITRSQLEPAAIELRTGPAEAGPYGDRGPGPAKAGPYETHEYGPGPAKA